MTLPSRVLDYGRVGLFFGTETKGWGAAEWTHASSFCRDHHVDFVLVKAFDAGNDWNIDQTPIRQDFANVGIKVVPYGFMGTADGYSYDLDRDLPQALGLCEKYMREFGVVCGDMEGGGWSDRSDLGTMLQTRLQPIQGQFWASIPANPVDARMVSSFRPMISAVDVWMPMAYSNYLGSVYKRQWAAVQPGLAIAPTLDLSNEFGPNDVLALTRVAGEQVSYWYEGFAVQNAGLFDKCVSVLKPLTTSAATIEILSRSETPTSISIDLRVTYKK